MSISTKIKSKKKVKKEKPTEQKSIGSIKSRMGQKDDQPPVKQEHHVHQYDQHHDNEDESGSQLSGGSNDSSEHIQTLPSNLKKQAHNTHQGNHNTPNQQQHQHQQQPYQQQMQEGQQQQQQYQHQQMQMQMQGFNQQNPNQMQQNQQMNNGQQQGFQNNNNQNNNNQNMKQHEGAHKSKSNEILQDQQSSESNQQNNTSSSFKKRQSALDYQRSSLSLSPDTIGKNKHINLVQKLKLEGSHLCLHHQQQFQFFCETCEEPICSQCTILGPHNNQLHRVNRMSEAFKSRYMKIQENIKDNLVTKREQILAQIHRVEYRVEEIKYIKTIIERDVRLEYEGLLDRLRQVEGTKLALLSHDISELQKDLDQINEIGIVFNDLTGSDMTDLSPFLLRSRYLYEQVEHLVAKPFKISIDVYPYDLPRELTELRLQLQKASAQKQLIEFKNEVIWKLMSEKKQDDLSQEFEKQTNEEVNEWSQLVDKFQGELDRFQVVCCYCGALLDPKIVNFPCGMNSQDSNPLVQTVEQPPYGFSGTNKHFFSKARN